MLSFSGVDDYYLFPIPLTLVLYTPGNGDTYNLRAVYYDDVKYDTIAALVEAYNAGNVDSRFTPNQHRPYSKR